MSLIEAGGLYAITPDALCADPNTLEVAVAAALRGGARLIQYRDKRSARPQRLVNATRLAALCRAQGAALIVNDELTLALEAGAAGVHLGTRDGSVAEARAALGPEAIIGATCGASEERAQAALAAGASYVAFGRFFASNTKPEAPPAAIEWLREARARIAGPVCAIGGVTPDNGAALLTAGVDWLAAVEGVFGDPDPAVVETRARRYAALFAR
jgi:thiamine-phosphate pyrophosphorylase